MPLPGGPSDKAGNRYESLWTVVCLLDVHLGAAISLRLEPPGEDAAEFVVQRESWKEFHQAKRGIGGEGKWSLAALSGVLVGFQRLLAASATNRCVFVSGHSAHELEELTERARHANDFAEFCTKFLSTSAALRDCLERLMRVWGVDAETTWGFLQRIRCETTSESQLQMRLDQLFSVLFEGNPATCRAVLQELVASRTHALLDATSIANHLMKHGIHRRGWKPTSAPDFRPPEAVSLFGRQAFLGDIYGRLREHSGIALVGPSGIGKTAVAAAIAAQWNQGPVFWMDCTLHRGFRQAVAVLRVAIGASQTQIPLEALHPSAPPRAVGRALGVALGALGALIIWDGAPTRESEEAQFYFGLCETLAAGRQLLTATAAGALAEVPQVVFLVTPPLSTVAVTELLLELTGRRPSAALLSATHGHPYLAHLAANLLRRLADEEAAVYLSMQGAQWVASAVFDGLSSRQRSLLEMCAVFLAGFASAWLVNTPEDRTDLIALVDKAIVVRGSGNRYVVHEVVRHLVEHSIDEVAKLVLHRKAALVLAPHASTDTSALREYAHHAECAGMYSEAARALTVLIEQATDSGEWSSVLSSTASLPDEAVGKEWCSVWYARGRALRMAGDFLDARECYRRAQQGADAYTKAIARFEEAAVLSHAGRHDEAKVIFKDLSGSRIVHVAIRALTSLAIAAGREGAPKEAASRFLRACELAHAAGDLLAEAQALQSWGAVELEAGNAAGAALYLRRALELRRSLSNDVSAEADAIGRYYMYYWLEKAEAALGDRQAASEAARGLFRFARLSGNDEWLSHATYVLSRNADPDDDDATMAREALAARLAAATAEFPVYTMVGCLAAAYWCVGQRGRALAQIFQFDSEGGHLRYLVVSPRLGDTSYGWFRAVYNEGVWIFIAEAAFLDGPYLDILGDMKERFPRSPRNFVTMNHPQGFTRDDSPGRDPGKE